VLGGMATRSRRTEQQRMQKACDCAKEDVRDPEVRSSEKTNGNFLLAFYRVNRESSDNAAALEFGHILASS